MPEPDPVVASFGRISAVIPVYRDAGRTISLVKALQAQRLPQDARLEIIIVDDGSNDGTAEYVEAEIGHLATLRRLPQNRGRSAARNEGASLARGELLIFIDCDCLPAGNSFLGEHLKSFTPGTVASTGPVLGNGEGFWHRYQAMASSRRERQHREGLAFSGSSQNLMALRQAFLSCGGFDEGYDSYGFEDRDFLIKMSRVGRIAWAPGAVMHHMDWLSMSQVSSKMREAGGAAALLFSRRYPDCYRELGYAALDVRLHPRTRIVAIAGRTILPSASRVTDTLVNSRWIPFLVKRLLVKGLSGLSFMCGTLDRTRSQHVDEGRK